MKFNLYENDNYKLMFSKDYKYRFNKKTGNFLRWGKTFEDDPVFSFTGPEIFDIEISTICNGIGNYGPCKFCSPAGTLINTPYGLIPIEKIKKDDYVIGYDIKNKNLKIQHVKELYERNYKGDLICIEMDNGNIVKVTPEHTVILKNGKEIKASDLKENDEIIFF